MVVKVVDNVRLLEALSIPKDYAGRTIDVEITFYLGTVYYTDLESGFAFSEEVVTFDLTPNVPLKGEAQDRRDTKPS